MNGTYRAYRPYKSYKSYKSHSWRSHNFLAERRQDQLHAQFGGLVRDVQYRVDLGQFERKHFARIGNLLHRQMALAISRPAGNRGSDPGREIRIDEIHIHRNVESAGTTRGHPHRLVHHRAIFGMNFRGEPADARQLRRAVSKNGGERHSVNVAGWGSFRRVHVAMRVEPDDSDAVFVLVVIGGESRYAAYG